MKFILTHKSWNMTELVELFKKSGSYTMCTLPHYRYRNVKDNCRLLEKHGFIERVSKSENALHWKTNELFRTWALEFDNGITKLWPINWGKEYKKREITHDLHEGH